MSDLLSYYKAQSTALPISDALDSFREAGRKALADTGFPTRKDEQWKYSEPKAWVNQTFSLNPTLKSDMHAPLEGIHVTFDADGVVLSSVLPEGLVICTLKEAMHAHQDKMNGHLGQQVTHADGFKALNSAMLNCGLFIYIAPHLLLDKPIIIHHANLDANTAMYYRHVVIADNHAVAKIIELFHATNDDAYSVNLITELFAKAHAHVEHFKIQAESLNAYHVGHLYAALDEKAHFESHLLNLGGHWVRSDTSVTFKATGGRGLLNGIYLPALKQHHDQHTAIFHELPQCQSDEDYKGVLSDEATAVFDGRVVVFEDASKTEAHQSNKNLLLSTKAQINTKPQLEIDTDDVICSHGTTVGQLSADALFYMATRGISNALGKMLLISGFAHENLAKINDKALRNYCEQWVKDKLEKAHGCIDL